MDIETLLLKIESIESDIKVKEELHLNALKEELADSYSLLQNLIKDDVQDQLSKNDYGCGTAHIYKGKYDIEVVINKKVEYDQEFLAGIYDNIQQSGENPTDYMKVTYGVEENKFKSWPERIKNAFISGRTVTPQKAKIKIKRIV